MMALACAETASISRADTPPALLRLRDTLTAERFAGLVAVEQPVPGQLRLVFREPGRCGVRPSDPAALSEFVAQVARRAVELYVPPPLQATAPVREVQVNVSRTHRFGALVWATRRASFAFPHDSLQRVSLPRVPACGYLPSLLRPPSGEP
jgi:hypothetical protein